jgi:hypothetical protein
LYPGRRHAGGHDRARDLPAAGPASRHRNSRRARRHSVPHTGVHLLPFPTGVFCDVVPILLSAAGDRPIYLSFFGTGFRGAKLDNIACSINEVQVPVVYAGPQATPGVDQINIRLLPEVLQGFFGEGMTVTIRMDGVAANSAWIAVR